MSQRMVNALSIDLEDWFHAELVRGRVRPELAERRVAWAVEPALLLLEQYRVRATFFVVGDVLRHHPDLVRRLYEAGHEIGCHGWSHRPLWTLEPERFAWELDAFDRDAAGVLPVEEVVGFRAPTFSLDARSAWALDILRQHGFRYDSSIFPVRTYLYGVEGCPSRPYRPTSAELTRDHAEGTLWEFPLTACSLAGIPWPVSGGFYLRATPWPLLRACLRRVNAKGDPFVLYLHPWEGDVHTPRVKGLAPTERFITYYGAASVWRKLEGLLQTFAFAPLREILGVEGRRAPQGEARP
jgi:polysaccharide deacetylase family protein (PEP-CTERM system associated)